MTQKSKLNRFYLSETFDENRNVSFNLKRANIKELKNFKTFREGVEEFNRVAATLEGDSKVWFHQNGAFRGSASPEKTITMLERVVQENVKDEEAIEFINREKLVDVSPAKAKKQEKVEETEEVVEQEPTVEVETTQEVVEEQPALQNTVNLDEEVKKLVVYVQNGEEKLAREVVLSDVKAHSEYEFVATSLRWEDEAVVVKYLLRHDGKESVEVTKVIKGFKAQPLPARTITKHFVQRTEWSKLTYWLLGIVSVVALICIIILVLHVYGYFSLYW
ncbi:hypothetical protein [Mycoplasma simbae]|uniref:hypothetical protein n=1 Tax=Mycoplasma simbae TaxID=36744 RepID=UPI00068F1803|nr:hypothetical protein [Mycoplasma simbae]